MLKLCDKFNWIPMPEGQLSSRCWAIGVKGWSFALKERKNLNYQEPALVFVQKLSPSVYFCLT
jgi:hypothetical protein